MSPIACPELYHIEHLYHLGYGCRLIAQAVDRDESHIDKLLRGKYPKHAKLIGRLSNGKRPAKVLARGWEVSR